MDVPERANLRSRLPTGVTSGWQATRRFRPERAEATLLAKTGLAPRLKTQGLIVNTSRNILSAPHLTALSAASANMLSK
jgi:hypothetical protein